MTIGEFTVLDDSDTYSGMMGSHAIIIENTSGFTEEMLQDLDNGPSRRLFQKLLNDNFPGVIIYEVASMIEVVEAARKLQKAVEENTVFTLPDSILRAAQTLKRRLKGTT